MIPKVNQKGSQGPKGMAKVIQMGIPKQLQAPLPLFRGHVKTYGFLTCPPDNGKHKKASFQTPPRGAAGSILYWQGQRKQQNEAHEKHTKTIKK